MALEYLEKQNIKILEKNFRCKIGEIDLICRDSDYLVFVEVKFRRSNAMGFPEEAVDIRKIKKICKVSDYYRMIRKIKDDAKIRFDVIAIKGEEISWIKNAFEYI